MTLHSCLKYLQYKWMAQNRHGVHSPFAYAFVEDVVENRRKLASSGTSIPWSNKPAVHYQGLLERMVMYYQYRLVVNASHPFNASAACSCDMLLMDNSEPDTWQQLLEKHDHIILDNSAVVVLDIHKTGAHTAAWEDISTGKRVTMSFDLFGMGILFFRKEFRVPQHFTLRLPE